MDFYKSLLEKNMGQLSVDRSIISKRKLKIKWRYGYIYLIQVMFR
jgi:hypothetical protein